MGLPSKEEFQELVSENPQAAWKKVKAEFKVPVPRAKVQSVTQYLQALRTEGDSLDGSWRKALIAFVEQDDGPFVTAARYAMSVAPHADFVEVLVASQTAWAEGRHDDWQREGESMYAWDQRESMVVLAAHATELATPVLETLLRPGTKISHWNLLLDACVQAGSPSLIPAIAQWRDHQAAKADDPKWEGLRAANKAIKALTALAKKKKKAVPETPRLGPLVREKKGKKR